MKTQDWWRLRLRSLLSRSIKGELLIAFILLTAVPSILIHIYYSTRIGRDIEAEVIQRSRNDMDEIARNMADLISQVHFAEQAIVGHIVGSPLFTRYDSLSLLDRFQQERTTWRHLLNLKWVYPFIEDIYVLNWDGRLYTSQVSGDYDPELYRQSPWLARLSSTPRIAHITLPHLSTYSTAAKADPHSISFLRSVDLVGRSDTSTVVQIDVTYQALRDALNRDTSHTGDGGRVILLDNLGKVMAASDLSPGDPGWATIAPPKDPAVPPRHWLHRDDDLDGLALEARVNADLRVVGRFPASELLTAARSVNTLTYAIVMAMIVFSVVVSVLLSVRITRPISDITAVMREVGQGDFSLKVPDHRNRDIHILTSSFNRMVDEIDKLMKDVVEKETERTQAELRALQARINPHFLYNTLDVIRGIALAHGDDAVVDMAEAMASLFRYSIGGSQQLVPLEYEIEHVRNYVRIQKYRYGERFTVAYDLDPKLLERPVIRLIVQPLVENAFQHGFARQTQQGKIGVEAGRENGSMVIDITDNGIGIAPGPLRALRTSLAVVTTDDASLSPGGIGLRNVDRRLKLSYGGQYGVSIHSRVGHGTRVEIRLPAESPS